MKIYIVAPSVGAYFRFINNLYHYGFIKKVDKELQVAVIHPEQVRGFTKQLVFILDGSEQNPFFNQIYEGVINRKNTVICCSPLISREAFAKLIFAASV